jgi:hypothetical protein
MIEYNSNINLIEEAINDQISGLAFENLILSLSKNGSSKTEIYEFLSKFQLEENEMKDYINIEKKYGDHPIELAMDRLWGWCHKDAKLLPNEVIYEK